MAPKYPLFFNWCVTLLAASLFGSILTAGELTPEQVAKVRQKISEFRSSLDESASNRNLAAGEVFMSASKDPKEAVALYLRCSKEVKFDRENRKESDYRAWRDGVEGRLKTPAVEEALQIQLRYLAISCRAAEVEDFAQVFGPLMEYVDGLSRLEEMPDGMLMQPVSRTIFAQAYYLENFLDKNEEWEPVAYNIAGIYEKAIFPYLRREKPEALMNAWDRRIEQQKRLVEFIEDQNQRELRGKDREQEVRIRNRQDSRGGILKDHDPDKFARETYPQLKWDKMVDYYSYIDQVNGAKTLLDYLEANLKDPKAETWLKEFEELISTIEGRLETAAVEEPEAETIPDPESSPKTEPNPDPNGFDPNGFDD